MQTVEFKRFGEANLDELVRQMGTDEGEYAILTSTLTAGTCNEWINAVLAYAAEKYPNLTLVCDPVCTNESIDEAYSKTLDLLTTYPDLKGIIGFSSPAPIGAGQAVSEMGLQGKVAVVGTCMPNDANALMKEGAISCRPAVGSRCSGLSVCRSGEVCAGWQRDQGRRRGDRRLWHCDYRWQAGVHGRSADLHRGDRR